MKTLTILKREYFSNKNLLVKETQINPNDSRYIEVDTIEVEDILFENITNEIEVFAKVDKRRKLGYRFETGEGVIL